MTHFPTKMSLGDLLKRVNINKEKVSFGRDAHRDWRVVCIVFLFLNLLSVGIGVFMYERVSEGVTPATGTQVVAPSRTLNTSELEQTIAFFDGKKVRFEKLKREQLPTSDPYISTTGPKVNK